MKRCSKCSNAKPPEDFYKSSGAKDGLTYWCRECMRQSAREHGRTNRERKKKQLREWRKSNPEKAAEYRRRHLEKYGKDYFSERERTRTLNGYGLSADDYENLLTSQGGVCAICKSSERVPVRRGVEQMRKLSIDHDHATGAVRGILCNICNRVLGLLQDDPALLLSAIGYLTRKPSGLPVTEA